MPPSNDLNSGVRLKPDPTVNSAPPNLLVASGSPVASGFSRTISMRIALAGVRAYQLLVRPMLAGTGACRFVPTCSEYAAEAITRHGALDGGLMALKRVMRCHPLGGRGFDPVS